MSLSEAARKQLRAEIRDAALAERLIQELDQHCEDAEHVAALRGERIDHVDTLGTPELLSYMTNIASRTRHPILTLLFVGALVLANVGAAFVWGIWMGGSGAIVSLAAMTQAEIASALSSLLLSFTCSLALFTLFLSGSAEMTLDLLADASSLWRRRAIRILCLLPALVGACFFLLLAGGELITQLTNVPANGSFFLFEVALHLLELGIFLFLSLIVSVRYTRFAEEDLPTRAASLLRSPLLTYSIVALALFLLITGIPSTSAVLINPELTTQSLQHPFATLHTIRTGFDALFLLFVPMFVSLPMTLGSFIFTNTSPSFFSLTKSLYISGAILAAVGILLPLFLSLRAKTFRPRLLVLPALIVLFAVTLATRYPSPVLPINWNVPARSISEEIARELFGPWGRALLAVSGNEGWMGNFDIEWTEGVFRIDAYDMPSWEIAGRNTPLTRMHETTPQPSSYMIDPFVDEFFCDGKKILYAPGTPENGFTSTIQIDADGVLREITMPPTCTTIGYRDEILATFTEPMIVFGAVPNEEATEAMIKVGLSMQSGARFLYLVELP